ncbi:hypothetical protein SPB21_28265 [Leptothoe sp. ISB3NOV94-8A]
MGKRSLSGVEGDVGFDSAQPTASARALFDRFSYYPISTQSINYPENL